MCSSTCCSGARRRGDDRRKLRVAVVFAPSMPRYVAVVAAHGCAALHGRAVEDVFGRTARRRVHGAHVDLHQPPAKRHLQSREERFEARHIHHRHRLHGGDSVSGRPRGEPLHACEQPLVGKAPRFIPGLPPISMLVDPAVEPSCRSRVPPACGIRISLADLPCPQRRCVEERRMAGSNFEADGVPRRDRVDCVPRELWRPHKGDRHRALQPHARGPPLPRPRALLPAALRRTDRHAFRPRTCGVSRKDASVDDDEVHRRGRHCCVSGELATDHGWQLSGSRAR